ncbi:MAG: hypothetical protein H7A24_16875 [Leptospiraceae bacterium]|nr:hypothetical protein [Leptospiraceae bacterium]MCP5513565.1 hypothetical protein [Leptospiraceae bacterium]
MDILTNVIFLVLFIIPPGKLPIIKIESVEVFKERHKIPEETSCEDLVASQELKNFIDKDMKVKGEIKSRCMDMEEFIQITHRIENKHHEPHPHHQKADDSGPVEEEQEFVGKLIKRGNISKAKTMEAYNGTPYYLVLPDSRQISIHPGPDFPKEKMDRYINKKVSVRCIHRLSYPSPHEQAPVDMNGNAIPRETYEVTNIRFSR